MDVRSAHAPCILSILQVWKLVQRCSAAPRAHLASLRVKPRKNPEGQTQETVRVRAGSTPSLCARKMELKKSISDTESALRSYGAVSETAWTTDKGELLAARGTSDPAGTGPVRSARCSSDRTESAVGAETVKVWLRNASVTLPAAERPVNPTSPEICAPWINVGPEENVFVLDFSTK